MENRTTLSTFSNELKNKLCKIGVLHDGTFSGKESEKISNWMTLVNDMAGLIKQIDYKASKDKSNLLDSMNVTFFKLHDYITEDKADISYFVAFEGASPYLNDFGFLKLDSNFKPTLYIGESYDDINLFAKNEKYKVKTLDSACFFAETEKVFVIDEMLFLIKLEEYIIGWYMVLFNNLDYSSTPRSENFPDPSKVVCGD